MVPPPDPASRPLGGTALEAVLILARVLVIIAVWIVLFLLTFAGYLALPVVLLVAAVVLYGIVELVSRARRAAGDAD